MPTKHKIAYCMHVDWDWIKQRPHFLYEELTRFYEVDLFYIYKLYARKSNVNANPRNTYTHSDVHTFEKLPFSGRSKVFRAFERVLNRKVLKSLNEYDYIWITSPLILDFISIEKYKQKIVIYDCMDDFLSFYTKNSNIDRLRELEVKLVQRADLVLSSSDYLKEKIVSSYKTEIKSVPYVINNGISDSMLRGESEDTLKIPETDNSQMLNLIYIGTIGEWIDFELIQYVLKSIKSVRFTMIGPIDTKVQSHPRLEYVGVVEHSLLSEYAKSADALIMPFMLTELVRSVDPVKIYEYISFQKPIFTVDYGEMKKFLPFVHLYSNETGFLELIEMLQNGEIQMYSKTEVNGFLKNNTWKERTKQIVAAIEGVSK